jgi:tetratricopeptide repeat protein 8
MEAARHHQSLQQVEVDRFFMAMTLFKHRKFGDCLEICNNLLEANPKDQSAWYLKVRALTEQTYIDEIEVEDEGIAESMMDDTTIADLASE